MSEREVAYELADWTPTQRSALTDLLDAAEIPYTWEGDGDLIVSEADDDAVEAILDELEYGPAVEELTAADVAGAEAYDDGVSEGAYGALGEVFVSSDLLMHNPESGDAAARLYRNGAAVVAAGPPFGFEAHAWRLIGAKTTTMLQLIGTEPDTEAVIAGARELRDLIRPHV